MKAKYFLVFFILTAQAALAQQGPAVSVTVTPDLLLPGIPFNLTFLVSHSDPDEVEIIAPSFPRELAIERVLKRPYSAGILDARIYTLVEYRIIAYSSGEFVFNSFEFQTPEGASETGAFSLIIHSPAPVQRHTTHSLRWDAPPSPITTGDRVTLTLRANNWNSQQPPASFFTPQAPHGMILSSQSVSSAERYEGIILKLLFIPLSAGNFILPARNLEHDTIRFEIPALNLNVINRN